MRVYVKLPYRTTQYSVETEEVQILLKLKHLYGQYCYGEIQKSENNVFITIVKSSAQYWRVNIDNCEHYTENPLQEIKNYIYSSDGIESGIFAMHAGGICVKNKASIFAASTTTGKTTLISYLAESGYKYVSDDCIYINMNNMEIYPCHNPLHLRRGGYDILRKNNIIPNGVVEIEDTYDERIVYMPENLSPDVMGLNKIYFINRNDAENSVRSLDKTTAIQRLLASPIKPYKITFEYLNFLDKLTSRCYDLYYKDMSYVRDLMV